MSERKYLESPPPIRTMPPGMRWLLLLPLLLLGGCPTKAPRTSGSATPPATLVELAPEIDALAAELTEHRWAPGLVIGLVRGDETLVRGYGRTGPDDATPPDGDTAFEIGSVTKVFTALLAADAERRGEISLDWTLDTLLPPDVPAPRHSEGPIQLHHLATHTSGLPRMPSNFDPADPADPFADYDEAALFDFLGGHELTRAPGAGYDYSNVGMGLLGHLVARHARTTYGELVAERILEPLGMTATASSVLPDQRAAVGHDAAGRPVPSWALDSLAGAGDLTSTAHDMLRFLQHQLAPPSGLDRAIRATHADQEIDNGPPMGLGWHLGLGGATGDPLRWHNGQTGGFHSYIAFDPVGRFGVVVLANQAEMVMDALGLVLVRMLRGQGWELDLPEAISVPADTLAQLEGEYPLSLFFVLSVRADGDQLFVKATGQPEFPVFATSETEFHYRVVPAKIVFTLDPKTGRATSLVLHQNGREMPGNRVEMPAATESSDDEEGDAVTP